MQPHLPAAHLPPQQSLSKLHELPSAMQPHFPAEHLLAQQSPPKMHEVPSTPQPVGAHLPLVQCWLQHTAETPHAAPSATQVGGPQTLLLHC